MSSWGIYAVAAHAASERARRHGDPRTIGAYDLVEIAAALLDQHVVPEVGTIEVREITNLFAAAFVRQGRAVSDIVRSEERRGGKGSGRSCRSRCSPDH